MKTLHRRNRRYIISIGACLCAIASTSLAQETPATPTTPRAAVDLKNLSRGDKNFIEDATHLGTEEVAISEIAATKATNQQVREFAQMMISDHTGAKTELASLASAKGVVVDIKKVSLEKWEKKSAKEFDSDYINKMVDDHEKAVKLFEKQAGKGEDSALMAFANKTLPTLQAHLGKAREIKKSLK